MINKVGNLDFSRRYGPWALVAGASRGLGAEFAAQIASRGLNLVLVARNGEDLQSVCSQLEGKYGVQTLPLIYDLSQETAAAWIDAQTAHLDLGLLVYNAAYSAIGLFLDTQLEEHIKEIETNCQTPMSLVHRFGKRMRLRGRGGILLMSSLSSSFGSAYIANYAATKAFNMILAEGLWEELRQQGVDVLACCAGAISTPGYLLSLQNGPKRSTVSVMSPLVVVSKTLAALGRQPSTVPGMNNRLAAFFMRKLLPRQVAIRIMGRVMRDMYSE